LYSGLERESSRWGRLWPPKQLCFVSKGFIWWGGFHLGFFFTLKTPKKNLSLRKFFVSSGFQVLGQFIRFLVAMDWFNKVFEVFYTCVWVKIGWKWVFECKNQMTSFIWPPQWPNSGLCQQRVIFFIYLGPTTRHPPP
jgi:hypothetical protein